MKRSYISPKAVVVKISLYDSCLDGDVSFGTNSAPEYSGAAGAKSARLSDDTDYYSSKASESWDE
jgi:hypothetical protein